MRNPLGWLRTRNAAIVARRTADAERTKGPAARPNRCAGCGTEMYGVVLCLGCNRYLCGRHKPVVDGVHPLGWTVSKPLVCTAPDDLVSLAAGVDVNPVPTFPEPICRHQWAVAPEGGAGHTVPHVCVRLDQHRRHKCACGDWEWQLGVRK